MKYVILYITIFLMSCNNNTSVKNKSEKLSSNNYINNENDFCDSVRKKIFFDVQNMSNKIPLDQFAFGSDFSNNYFIGDSMYILSDSLAIVLLDFHAGNSSEKYLCVFNRKDSLLDFIKFNISSDGDGDDIPLLSTEYYFMNDSTLKVVDYTILPNISNLDAEKYETTYIMNTVGKIEKQSTKRYSDIIAVSSSYQGRLFINSDLGKDLLVKNDTVMISFINNDNFKIDGFLIPELFERTGVKIYTINEAGEYLNRIMPMSSQYDEIIDSNQIYWWYDHSTYKITSEIKKTYSLLICSYNKINHFVN